MATKKNTRSSKTDHVLSLLSNSSAPEPAAEEVPAAAEAPSEDSPAAAPAVAAAPATETPPSAPQRLSPPILEVARTNNEALEATIHQALEAALEEDVATPPVSEPMPQPAPAVPPEPVSVPVPEAMPESAAMPEPVSMDEPAPILESAPLPVSEPAPEPAPAAASAAVPAPEPSPKSVPVPEPMPEVNATVSVVPPDPEAAATRQILPDGSRMINVMEYLVSQKVEYYAHMFQLCCCPRCLADSMALALSRLPAKYVVLPEQSYRPMLSFLEAKFDSMVTAQVIYACKQVLEAPRHTQS